MSKSTLFVTLLISLTATIAQAEESALFQPSGATIKLAKSGTQIIGQCVKADGKGACTQGYLLRTNKENVEVLSVDNNKLKEFIKTKLYAGGLPITDTAQKVVGNGYAGAIVSGVTLVADSALKALSLPFTRHKYANYRTSLKLVDSLFDTAQQGQTLTESVGAARAFWSLAKESEAEIIKSEQAK
jgi:hypothetical protein